MAKKYGLEIQYTTDLITVSHPQSKNRIIISAKNLPYLIELTQHFDYYMHLVIPQKDGEWNVVNYSSPRLHTLSSSKLELKFASLPEADDVTEIYLDRARLREGNVVIDLGSYSGGSVYSFSKSVGQTGKVIAVEADPGTFEVLKFNINKHNLANVTPVNKAVWSSTTTLQFQAEGNLGSAIGGVSSRSNKTIDIPSISFADLLRTNNIEKADFIKMDIEGSEVEVIKSMAGYLKAHRTPMIVEVHKDKNGVYTNVPLEPVFKDLGYNVEYVKQDGTHCVLMYVH